MQAWGYCVSPTAFAASTTVLAKLGRTIVPIATSLTSVIPVAYAVAVHSFLLYIREQWLCNAEHIVFSMELGGQERCRSIK